MICGDEYVKKTSSYFHLSVRGTRTLPNINHDAPNPGCTGLLVRQEKTVERADRSLVPEYDWAHAQAVLNGSLTQSRAEEGKGQDIPSITETATDDVEYVQVQYGVLLRFVMDPHRMVDSGLGNPVSMIVHCLSCG